MVYCANVYVQVTFFFSALPSSLLRAAIISLATAVPSSLWCHEIIKVDASLRKRRPVYHLSSNLSHSVRNFLATKLRDKLQVASSNVVTSRSATSRTVSVSLKVVTMCSVVTSRDISRDRVLPRCNLLHGSDASQGGLQLTSSLTMPIPFFFNRKCEVQCHQWAT